jgi:hypothetical protein
MSGAVSEPMRRYALRLAEVASPKASLDRIAAFGRTAFRADVAAVTVPTLVSELVVIEGGPHGATPATRSSSTPRCRSSSPVEPRSSGARRPRERRVPS